MMPNPHPDPLVEDSMADNMDTPPPAQDDDARSDIEQAVQARADAVERGEGGAPPGTDDPGEYSGVSGDGGEVKNQDINAQ